jgi:hydroxymethylglutaryl-CoA reductase
MAEQRTSRISGFFRLTADERRKFTGQWAALSPDQTESLKGGGLTLGAAAQMIENAVGLYAMPMGIATNFLINGRDVLVPMVIEEPSVVAACSNAARIFRAGGGVEASSDEPVMIGQIQVLDIPDLVAAAEAIARNRQQLIDAINAEGGSIVRRGGGVRDIRSRSFAESAVGPMLVVHILMDTRDAMGANAVNTAAEFIAPQIAELTGGRVNLRILSNLTDERKARASVRIPSDALSTGDVSGDDVIDAIVEASVFAEIDPYRAATHNKGIMNGVDAVVIATGNDWRAIEAGAHAYAARSGRYISLSTWRRASDGSLEGMLEMPLAVGIVGGATRVHPTARAALQILGVSTARELAEICAAVGLAQNFAAIRALATEGIQRGHMQMHARQLATAAGASPHEVAYVVDQLIREGSIRAERARVIVEALHRTE